LKTQNEFITLDGVALILIKMVIFIWTELINQEDGATNNLLKKIKKIRLTRFYVLWFYLTVLSILYHDYMVDLN